MKSVNYILCFAVCCFITTTAWAQSSALQPSDNLLHLKPKTKNTNVAVQEGDEVHYAIFRSNGDVYFKGRAGYLTDYTDEAFEDISIEEIINSFDEHGALGIGAGYTLKSGNKLEFEYTVTKRQEQILQIEYLF